MTITDYFMREMLVPVFKSGKLVYNCPTLMDIQRYANGEMDSFWAEYKRLHSPHRYKVDLSRPLYDLKQTLLATSSKRA